MPSQRSGRNAKRKVARLVEKQLHQAEYFSSAGTPKHKEVAEADVQQMKAELRAQIADLRMANWRADLLRAAKTLGSPGCWALFHRHRNEAVALQVEGELRDAVVEAASKFFGAGKGSVLPTRV